MEVGYPNDSELYSSDVENNAHCFCYTYERPKVEYSYCYAGDFGGNFSTCAQEKVQAGWYPIAGLAMPSNGGSILQAFWRWAE